MLKIRHIAKPKNDICHFRRTREQMTFRNKLIILLLASSLFLSCQTKEQEESFEILAKIISYEGGDKIHYLKCLVLKELTDSAYIKTDTILVGYYNYKVPEKDLSKVHIILQKEQQNNISNTFNCLNYNGTKSISKVQIDEIEFDFWRECEEGSKKCKPLTFIRPKEKIKWFLIFPCGGTVTDIDISSKENSGKKKHIKTIIGSTNTPCPPLIELTEEKDGTYYAYMIACGLGGQVEYNLITNTNK